MQNLLQLQAPYNEVKYYIIGDDNAATYFSIGEEDGIVRVARTLNEDDAENYRIRVQAADGDNPPKTSTEIISVRVDRNLNAPIFSKPDGEGATDTITIKEDENFQKVLYRVEARDADRRVGCEHPNEWSSTNIIFHCGRHFPATSGVSCSCEMRQRTGFAETSFFCVLWLSRFRTEVSSTV